MSTSPFDYVLRRLTSRLDWRVKYRLGFYQHGCTRVFRIGKLCIHLWEAE